MRYCEERIKLSSTGPARGHEAVIIESGLKKKKKRFTEIRQHNYFMILGYSFIPRLPSVTVCSKFKPDYIEHTFSP